MTVVLWILGILLALLVLLCLTRVGVHALFGDALALDAKIGPFRIHILPGQKQDKKREKRAKEPKEAEKGAHHRRKKPFPLSGQEWDAHGGTVLGEVFSAHLRQV